MDCKRAWTKAPLAIILARLSPTTLVGRHCPERCQSGRMGLTRNQVYARAYRGFESHPLRQLNEETAFNSIFYVVIDLSGPPIGPPLRHRFRRHSPEILLNFVFVASDTLTVLDQSVQDRSVLDVVVPNTISSQISKIRPLRHRRCCPHCPTASAVREKVGNDPIRSLRRASPVTLASQLQTSEPEGQATAKSRFSTESRIRISSGNGHWHLCSCGSLSNRSQCPTNGGSETTDLGGRR